MNILRAVFVFVVILIGAGCSNKTEVEPGATKPQATQVQSKEPGETQKETTPINGLASDFHLRISFIEGEVQMKPAEAEDWGFVSMNDPVSEGDQFWVPQSGKLEIQANTGTYIRLDQESSLQILSLEKNSLQLYVSKGHAYILKDAPKEAVTQVDTSDASTRVFAPAIFRVDLMDKYTDVAVYKDYVETENKTGSTRVNAGEMVTLGLESNGEIAPMGEPDEWEKWNRARNDELFARVSTDKSSNLPEELKPYSSDLNNSGKWVQVPEHGKVWIPTVGTNWAPYSDGRWIWRGGDYVWVASESWGWAPYHYGRWAFVEGTGWCWVPPVASEAYWSPGYVGWVTTGDYVAWVPLAPGEIYYGRGYYGRNSVNITDASSNRVNITNAYKNVHVNNGVTVIRRNTFATASPRMERLNQKIIEQKIFTKNNMSVGTPAIKPTRASYFASAKVIPASKRPPQSVRNLQVKELKQSRPFTKEQSNSVLNPGSKARALAVNTVKTPRTPGSVNPGRSKKPEKPGKSERGGAKVAPHEGRHRGEGNGKPDKGKKGVGAGNSNKRNRNEGMGNPSKRNRNEGMGNPNNRNRNEGMGNPNNRNRNEGMGNPNNRNRGERAEKPDKRNRNEGMGNPNNRNRNEGMGNPSKRNRNEGMGNPNNRNRGERAEKPDKRNRGEKNRQ